MRLGLFVLVVALGGAAIAVRPDPRLPEIRRQVRETPPVAQAAAVRVAAEVLPAPISPAPVRNVSSSVEAVAGATSGAETPEALVGVLARLLSLDALQKARIHEILWERAQRVREYEQEVARRGWAKLSDFEQRISQVRDLAHRQVLALLSSAQAAEYERAVAAGIPEDHLSIEIPENVVRLD